ncbi:MAG TPA: hypothetical protein VKZ53_12470 [Candidatus Angelobacter sp.]|nr:hypothetical protein [Candidatus Angelobacter sp.]
MKATFLKRGGKVIAIGMLNPDLKPITPPGIGDGEMRISLRLMGGKGARASEVEFADLTFTDTKDFSKKMGELRATLEKTNTRKRRPEERKKGRVK